jgi:hypothetical protein
MPDSESTDHLYMLGLDRILLLATLAAGAVAYAKPLPLMFEPNMGQAGQGTLFLGRGPGYTIQFDARGIELLSGQSAVRMNLRGASSTVRTRGYEPQAGRANYLLGRQDQWIKDIPLYGGVRYEDVYPGISLVFYSNGGDLEYDFSLAPGAVPSAIRLSFSGMESMRIEGGDLVLKTASGELRHKRPRLYQQKNGRKAEVGGRFVILGPSEAGFEPETYDAATPLVIDPVMAYATFVGGSSSDTAWAVAVDSTGCAYVAGETWPVNFPRTFTISSTTGNQDAFLVKMNQAGTAVLYATYFGGQGRDSARSVAVDAAGNAYVTGFTYSSNFPVTTGAYRSPSLGQGDAFAMKVNAAGSALVYSALLGGSGSDFATGIAVDGAGNAYISGYTSSVAFPVTTGVPQPSFGGGFQDAFVAKLNPTGSGLIYATYLGGTGNDVANGIAVDSLGSAYVAGYTDSPNFPTRNPFQASAGGQGDAFIGKLSPAGDVLAFSTYLGGRQADIGTAVALDSVGNIYITGSTLSTDFPVTAGAFQTVNHGSYDAFVSVLNPQGSGLIYSTYVGGEGADQAASIAVDAGGVAYIAGFTYSSQFPVQSPVQPSARGGQEAFAVAVRAAGTSLSWSTYLGDAGDDQAAGIAVDTAGGVYVAGSTLSANFPATAGAYRTASAGGDGFLVKLTQPSPAPTTVSVTPASGTGIRQAFTFRATDPAGYGNLAYVMVLVSDVVRSDHTCLIWYNLANHSINLASDQGQWTSPVVINTAGTAQNSQCVINAASSSAVGSGTQLSLTLDITFQTTFAGQKSSFLLADNLQSLRAGWTPLGTWTITVLPPQVVSVTPSSGAGARQSFTFRAADPSGYANLSYVMALVSDAVRGDHTCLIWYNLANNSINLASDVGQWTSPVVLNTAGTTQNSQCLVNAASSSAAGSGTQLALTLDITFKPTFAGPKSLLLLAQNPTLRADWTPLGTWTTSALPPQVVSVTPSSGAGVRQVFTFRAADPAGYGNLSYVMALVSDAVRGDHTCLIWYNLANNSINLASDVGQWTSPVVLNTAGISQNSQCVVNAASSSAAGSGTQLSLTLDITFKPTFAGPKSLFLLAQNPTLRADWTPLGTWTSSALPPQVVSVTPSSGAGVRQVFTFRAADPAGYGNLSYVMALVSDAVRGDHTCLIWYDPANNSINLASDLGQWTSPVVLNTAGTTQNSQCVVNAASSSAVGSGTQLALTLDITFKPTFAGPKSLFLLAQNPSFRADWTPLGTWTTSNLP